MAERTGTDDTWAAFRYFLGNWTGTGSGTVGNCSAERSYALTLSGAFIQVVGRSVFEPQPANPSGEVHEEMAMLSYDRDRSLHVLREFLVEGMVNQYVLERHDESLFTFVTESSENFTPGWRARTTLEILSRDSFREVFELAGPAGEWACYIRNDFQRVAESTAR